MPIVTLRTPAYTFTVEAEVCGPLALHSEEFDVRYWRVSHIASGCSILTTKKQRVARHIMRRLAAEVDWSGIEYHNGTLTTPPDYLQRIALIKRIIAEEGVGL